MFLGQAGASLGLLWLGSLAPELLAQAHEHAQSVQANSGKSYRFFTPQQAADYDAFAAQIIPTDDTPGAREANVVHFTDFLLSGVDSDQQAQFRDALTALHDQAVKIVPGAKSFAALTPEQQIAAIKAMEKNPPFWLLRGFVLTGCFCDPSLGGGNKDQIGWKLIGFKDDFYYSPPFGYYDAHYNEGK
jgi:gluconate 2-dehydrogenase gamma chain